MNFKKDEGIVTPTKGHSTDAGYDIYAPFTFLVEGHDFSDRINLGVAFEIPEGYVGIISERSSQGKIGISTVGNIVDHGYTGNVHVTLINNQAGPIQINKGDRMTQINAWAALGPKEKLVPHKFDPGQLKADEIEVKVEHCGLCHSDVSVINNDWGLSQFPLVPGHEVVGKIVALGNSAKRFEIGERVGVGWNSESDMYCRQCLSGNHHLCPNVVPTIIGHRGGFADRIRAQWQWVLPLPHQVLARVST